MPPRFHVDAPLAAGTVLALPPGPARHVQVLRLQPGAALLLFDGHGGEWQAVVDRIGRRDVDVRVGAHDPVDREPDVAVTLAVGMPANERMDALIEKATELGVAAIQPLLCERSVLRLAGERAARRVEHWQGVAVAACEQSGRTRVPRIEPVRSLAEWLAAGDDGPGPVAGDGSAPVVAPVRVVLSLQEPARPLPALGRGGAALGLSGPEGGFTAAEEALARRAGFAAVSLGPRVLRADTAPLAMLAAWALAPRAAAGADRRPGDPRESGGRPPG